MYIYRLILGLMTFSLFLFRGRTKIFCTEYDTFRKCVVNISPDIKQPKQCGLICLVDKLRDDQIKQTEYRIRFFNNFILDSYILAACLNESLK